MAKGRIYGFIADGGLGRLTCRRAPLTLDVCRANSTARLDHVSLGFGKERSNILVHILVVVQTRMPFASIKTASEWST